MIQRPVDGSKPAEKRPLPFDFKAKIPTGDSISSVLSITADAGLTVTSGTISGTTVTTTVSGGTDGTKYNVSCKVNTVNGNILELDGEISVLEGAN